MTKVVFVGGKQDGREMEWDEPLPSAIEVPEMDVPDPADPSTAECTMRIYRRESDGSTRYVLVETRAEEPPP